MPLLAIAMTMMGIVVFFSTRSMPLFVSGLITCHRPRIEVRSNFVEMMLVSVTCLSPRDSARSENKCELC